MKKTFPTTMLIALLINGVGCTNGFYDTKKFQNYDLGVTQAARELSQGRFVSVSQPPSGFGWSGGISVIGNTRPKQLREDITFEQYLTRKYGIKYRELNHTTFDYVIGYNSVMTAALRERYGDDYFERARHEFYPDVPEGDFINGR